MPKRLKSTDRIDRERAIAVHTKRGPRNLTHLTFQARTAPTRPRYLTAVFEKLCQCGTHVLAHGESEKTLSAQRRINNHYRNNHQSRRAHTDDPVPRRRRRRQQPSMLHSSSGKSNVRRAAGFPGDIRVIIPRSRRESCLGGCQGSTGSFGAMQGERETRRVEDRAEKER